jgi:hypothetical protein
LHALLEGLYAIGYATRGAFGKSPPSPPSVSSCSTLLESWRKGSSLARDYL